ncbi:unnamed protein product [Rhodiola kirilowii]
MDDEMESLLANETWELVELPRDKKALHNNWVYYIKEEGMEVIVTRQDGL